MIDPPPPEPMRDQLMRKYQLQTTPATVLAALIENHQILTMEYLADLIADTSGREWSYDSPRQAVKRIKRAVGDDFKIINHYGVGYEARLTY